jgi:site-specific recombinase XerD
MNGMSWDRGLDFENTYAKLLRHMSRAKPPAKCYDAILLIQLRNGSRVSEAVRAFLQFLRAKSLEVEVEVSKKRKREKRLMVIPSELLSVVSPCFDLRDAEERKLVDRVKNYCRYTYGFNTHSLRYAFITYLLRMGVSPSIVAKITRHSRLEYIQRYTQEKVAEDTLRNLP